MKDFARKLADGNLFIRTGAVQASISSFIVMIRIIPMKSRLIQTFPIRRKTNGTVICVGSRRTDAHHNRADLEIGGAFQKGLTKDENHNVGQERRGSAPVKTAVDAHQEAQKDT
jgi:hypothetical protein